MPFGIEYAEPWIKTEYELKREEEEKKEKERKLKEAQENWGQEC